ncbi:hypothetical protein B0I08_1134 [Glaciihabitans tibetensis]|uniref:Uncharacterized protein n=2 Tax=Glaciihabitans tibetensis TaxID=1266600 RepID=A0A2T0V2F1_9MICO|nr:hypothetical protein B0I08_1134 [Glaciihabitans tibetensis]
MPHGATQSADIQVVVTWMAPEDNLWVASVNGEYAGMVEFFDGHFVARDSSGHELSSHSNLPEAKAVVDERMTTAPSLLVAVHNTLHHMGETLAATLPRAAPQYHRSAAGPVTDH